MAVAGPRATIRRMRFPTRLAPLRVRAGAAALVVALLAVACGPPSPSPAPSGSAGPTPGSTTPATGAPSPGTSEPAPSVDTAALYRAIEEQVVEIRGLQPKAEVDPQVLDEAELKRRVEESFKEDNPAELVAASERLYKALGLMDEDASLEDLYLELLGSQVAGFYSPEDDELYVVSRSGGLGVVERVTFAHEYTHALQDQNFDLEAFGLDDPTQGDRNMGHLALIEGDATAVMSYWSQQHLTPEETVELLQQSLDPEQLEILRRMPPILRESLEFPYNRGLQLVLQIQSQGGWDAVDAAFDRPPASTEQVIHLDAYDANEAPIAVDLPNDLGPRMGAGWRVGLEDTFGEFQLGVWLRTVLQRVGPGNDAAAGWGGDRVTVINGPSGAWAVALVTEWDSADEAREFADAAGEALTALGGHGGLATNDGSIRVTVLLASDQAAAIKIDSILGATGN